MKVLTASKRVFPSIGKNKEYSDYLGTAVITKDVTLTTGYQGRGVRIETKKFDAGTKVAFSLKSLGESKCYLQIEVLADRRFSTSYDFQEPLDSVAKKLRLDAAPDYFTNGRGNY